MNCQHGGKCTNVIREAHSITFSLSKIQICDLRLLMLKHGPLNLAWKTEVISNLKWKKLSEREITQV